jgi:hypothetical protein
MRSSTRGKENVVANALSRKYEVEYSLFSLSLLVPIGYHMYVKNSLWKPR